jgi:hypothetical protein
MGGKGPAAATGCGYLYYDPADGKIVTSPFQLTVDKGALDVTLDSVFNDPAATTGFILYNDEMPDEVKSSKAQSDNGSLGHTKGALAFDPATKTACGCSTRGPSSRCRASSRCRRPSTVKRISASRSTWPPRVRSPA